MKISHHFLAGFAMTLTAVLAVTVFLSPSIRFRAYLNSGRAKLADPITIQTDIQCGAGANFYNCDTNSITNSDTGYWECKWPPKNIGANGNCRYTQVRTCIIGAECPPGYICGKPSGLCEKYVPPVRGTDECQTNEDCGGKICIGYWEGHKCESCLLHMYGVEQCPKGTACNTPDGRCTPPGSQDPPTPPPTPTPIPVIGSTTCSPGYYKTVVDYRYNSQKVWVADNCPDGTFCKATTLDSRGTLNRWDCKPKGTKGESCEKNGECVSNSCVNGTCAASADEQEEEQLSSALAATQQSYDNAKESLDEAKNAADEAKSAYDEAKSAKDETKQTYLGAKATYKEADAEDKADAMTEMNAAKADYSEAVTATAASKKEYADAKAAYAGAKRTVKAEATSLKAAKNALKAATR